MRKKGSLRVLLLLLALAVVAPGCRGGWWDVFIDRQAETPAEEAIILAAEKACPLREDVLAAAAPEDTAALEAEAGDGCLWWYGNAPLYGRELKLPYAVTADAVDYYADRVEQARLAREASWLPFPLMAEAYLSYTATIEPQSDFIVGEKQHENIYLVHMWLSYGESSLLPMRDGGVSKKRTVAVSAAGEVLAVFGDGPAPLDTWSIWSDSGGGKRNE